MTDPPPAEPSLESPGRATSLSLIERARRNDPDSWHRLLHLYGPMVLYWCGRAGVRPPDADDVSQDVFRAVAGRLADFRRDRPGDTFRGWLRGITRNVLLAHHRRAGAEARAAGGSDARRRMHDLPAPDPTPAPDEDDPPDELRGLYHRALELVRAEFEARTWRAFWRATVDGVRPADVAAELGMSAAGVRQAKSRVLRRLKEEVGDLGD